MPPAVTFDYPLWVQTYPKFAAVDQAQAQAWFNLAGAYCQNQVCNPIWAVDDGVLLGTILNLITAHLAMLFASTDSTGAPTSGGQQGASGIVGRISSASQGSVSVSSEWKGEGSPSEAWYIQTPYGAAAWQAMAPWRTFRYQAQPTVVYGGRLPFFTRWPTI